MENKGVKKVIECQKKFDFKLPDNPLDFIKIFKKVKI